MDASKEVSVSAPLVEFLGWFLDLRKLFLVFLFSILSDNERTKMLFLFFFFFNSDVASYIFSYG